MGPYISVILASLAGLVAGALGGWYARQFGEGARKQALEANHREFIRAAGLARDRARAETEEVEQRLRRFRADHEACDATIEQLRSKVGQLRSELAGQTSTLKATQESLDKREAALTGTEKQQQASRAVVRKREQRLAERVKEVEALLAERDDQLAKLSHQVAVVREAHAGCANVTLRLEEQNEMLKGKLATREQDQADGKPAWLQPGPTGKKDDLTVIRGLGPVLERSLNQLGIYHFHQLARMDASDVEWVAGHIRIFPGRIRKDRWVEQAKAMQPADRNVS